MIDQHARASTPEMKAGCPVPRRDFFSRMGDGLHGAALASLLGADLFAARPALAADSGTAPGIHDLRARPPHFEPKARSVIHLFMNGGPSQVDLFDPKPRLEKHAGQVPSRDLTSDVVTPTQIGGILPSPYAFSRHGGCGMELSELLPYTARCADDIALVRSMHTTTPNHEPGIFLMQGGRITSDRPSMGAWIAYGLGAENQDLPAYVVLDDPKGLPVNGIQNWQSAWLPPIYQGTRFRAEGPPVLNLAPRAEFPPGLIEAQRSLLARLDAAHGSSRSDDPRLAARIANYELAARMQIAASDALDLSRESEETLEAYGLSEELTASYGRRCLMARRLVERGVRFVQIYTEGQIWDAHTGLDKSLRYSCGKTDRPTGALLMDLKRRGLLDSTLVIWGGEFGRLPLAQTPGDTEKAGRDHGPSGFSVWLAGGGVKGGTIHGATDELGHKAVEGRVSVHDFHATILYLLGMDFEELVFERHGLAEKLTDQARARVVSEIIG